LAAGVTCHRAHQGIPFGYSIGYLSLSFADDSQLVIDAPVRWFATLRREYQQVLLDDLASGDPSRRIVFYHVFPPHNPFIFDRDGRPSTFGNFYFVTLKRFDQTYAQYLNSVRVADRRLGVLVEGLKARGLYERSILIVTSDHGMRPHFARDARSKFEELAPWVTRVPLFIRAPGVQPGKLDQDYQHVDLTPTLLDLLDVELGTPSEGVSAFSDIRPRREKIFYFDPPTQRNAMTYDRAAAQWRWLLPHNPDDSPARS
jgi:arylsulfatase A-like enzyme